MSTSPQPAEKRLRQPPPGRQPMYHRIFRADPLTVRTALQFLRERFDGSAGNDVIGKLELALAEVLNNICEHGIRHEAVRLNGRPHAPLIHLCVARHVGGIACAITDDGKPLPASCLEMRSLPWSDPAPRDPAKLISLPERGFGWFLIQELSASLSYFREGRRNFLAFIIPVTEPLLQGGPAPRTPEGRQGQFSPNCNG